MRRVRATLRAVRAGFVTAFLYLAWLAGHLMLVVAPRARPRWRRAVMRRWCTAMCRALGVEIAVTGTAPRGGVFLVSNHLGYLDILVIGATLPTTFVSKAEVEHWPVIGLLARHFRTIFVARERKRNLPEVNRRIADALALGDGVVVFPEGTSTRGDVVLPFRPSLLAPVADGVVNVHAAAVHYATAPSDPPASLSVCWWGDMEFVPHLRVLLGLETIRATVAFDPEPIRCADRKQLADLLSAKVKSLFRPVP